MNKIFVFVIILVFSFGCSFNQNSKFWTSYKEIIQEDKKNYKKIFVEEKALNKEFNSNLKLNLKKTSINLYKRNYQNNDGMLNYNGQLKRSSRYKF